MNEFLIQLQAILDKERSKGNINKSIERIQNQINKLKIQADVDPKSILTIKTQLEQITNQSITLTNINIDQNQIDKTGKEIGKKLGANIDKYLQSNLNDVRQNINDILKNLGNNELSTVDLSKMFNLDRASLDSSIKEKVRGLTKELNSLAKEVVTTNSKGSWEKLIENVSSLNKVLTTSGMSRDIISFKESLDVLDYFQNKKIFVGDKSEALLNTGLSVKELNNQFRNLGVTFTTVSEGSTKLDSIWSELFNFSPNLRDITSYSDQLNAIVEHLKTAKNAKFGESNLIPVNNQDVSKVLVDWLNNVEKLQRKMEGFQQDQAEIEQKIVQQSNNSTENVVNNERKKQKEFENTAKAKQQASSKQEKIPTTDSIIKTNRNIISFDNANNAARKASEYFKNLLENEKAVISISEQFDNNNSLNSFTVNVKRANGEVESLRYSLKNIGTIENPLYAFADNGGSVNNSNAIRQIRAIENALASFTQKYEQFKSFHNSKLSGLTEPLSDFESKLNGLKSGINTIDEVKNSFSMLRAAASEIDAPLKRQLDTFSSYKNAVDKGKESISGYRAELKGLSNAPKELSQELTKASKLLLQINRTELREGTTANWSRQAKDFKDILDSIRNKINVLKKEQANSASTQIFNVKDIDRQGKIYLQKVYNTVEKTKSELESKLRNAGYTDIEIKGTEDASGKIKSLTANVTDAAGAFKQLNFERAKIQNQGKAQLGFIQSDDVKVMGSISSSIKTTQNNLSSLKTKWQEQGILVGGFKTKVEQLEKSIASISSKNALNALKSQISDLKNEASKLLQANKIQFQVDTGGYESKVETLISRTMQWTDGNGNAKISTDALKQSLDKLNAASDAYANKKTEDNQRRLIEAEKELDRQINTVTNSVRKMNAELAKDTVVSSLHNKIQSFYDNNTAAHRQWGSQLKQMLAETASGAELTTQRVREIEQSFNGVATAARQAGKVGKSWFQSLKDSAKNFTYFASPTFITMKAISEIKQGVNAVKELDTALVDLKKTTTMTSSQLEKFYYDSNDTAKQMGVATSEIINQASAWSRLGYSSAEAATQMAKHSSLFASISPGMNVDDATTSLVSIMKSYDVEVNDVLDGVLSKINDIGNKFGTSNAEIAEGLKNSSAAIAAVGGTLEDNIALFTAGQEIVQDASQVGNAIRSIALRIRGYDEETEQLSDDLVDVTGKVADLTKVTSNSGHGISLFTDASQTEYKSLVTYLGEISDIWDELDQKSQNELLDKLFGKNRAQVGAAIIKNFDAVRNSIEAMENSAGSADREMSVIMDSLDYKLNRLKETGTGIAQNLFERDEMKSIVDGFTSFLEIIDSLTSKIGLLGTIGAGAGLFVGLKNVGSPKMFGLKMFEYTDSMLVLLDTVV